MPTTKGGNGKCNCSTLLGFDDEAHVGTLNELTKAQSNFTIFSLLAEQQNEQLKRENLKNATEM